MVHVILREILILVVSLVLFPTTMLALVLFGGADPARIIEALRDATTIESDDTNLVTGPLSLWIRLFTPYLAIQAFRGYFWSKRSLVGRKWTSCYYFLLASVGALWAFAKAFDLFYFMWQLGDIPAELGQYVYLEADSIVLFACSVCLAQRFLRIFINPKGLEKIENERSDGRSY